MKQCFRNNIGDLKKLPGADIDTDQNPVVAEVKIRLEVIKKAGKRNQNGIWKESRVKKNNVKEVIEQKFSQIDGLSGGIEIHWGK